jgi:acyl transferase domain-containing protein/SAM-dependent methyltransferase/acyl carrier protein
VLAESPADAVQTPATGAGERPRHLLAISARTGAALRDAATRLARDIEVHPDRPIADVCFTANTGRAHFAERAAVIASDSESLRQGLDAVAEGRSEANVIVGRAEGSEPPPVAFLFTGQGSQYVGMARELFDTQPAFRRALESCDAVFRSVTSEPLIDTLYPDEAGRARALARIDRTGFTQPALFAIEVALAELWRTWGIVPSVVMGHSVGEYVAACVAGMMTMEEGLGLVIERARLMEALPEGGAMAAVLADEERVRAACAPYSRTVSIAAINGPRNVVVSGAAADVEAIRLSVAAAGMESRPLAVSHAFHSPLLDPMLDALERAASRIAYAEPKLDVVSNLTGQLLRAGEVSGAYWKRHAREAVRFADAVRTAAAQGCRFFIEIGPAPILTGMAAECLAGGDSVLIPTLRRGRSDLEQTFAALGRVYAGGARVDWKGFEQGTRRSVVSLPTYPFQRERFWPERRLRRLADGAERRESWRDWLYEFQWAETGSGTTRVVSFETRSIAGRVQLDVDGLWREHGADVYDVLYPRLDAVCAAYIVSGLRELGCGLKTGDRLDVRALRERCGVLTQHARLWERLFATLAEDGLLRRDGEETWVVVREPEHANPDAAMQELLGEFPQCRAELGFTAQAAPALADVLTGRRDPIDVLFPAGSLEAAEALYERAPALRVFNTLVARTVQAAKDAMPPTQELRVLELGAGTGGTSSYVLDVLSSGRARYVYTDISPLFTARAAEKFKKYDFVEYRTLNIEEDPSAQGFAPGEYDLILAANVLHATADLNQTLAHAKQLLAPGGMLVILESTRKQRFGDLTVGYTDGWWRFADDVRTDYALLPPERWLEVLRAAGFEAPMQLPAREEDRAVFANQSVFTALAPASSAAAPKRSDLSGAHWVVCAGSHQIAAAIVAEIDSRGGEGSVVETDLLLPADLRGVIDGLRARLNGRRWGVILAGGGRAARLDDALDVVESTVRQSCGPALHLAQALAAAETNPAPQLVIVTRGAQATRASETVDPAQAPVWGLGRVIELEHPELACLRVDLPAQPAKADITSLVDALAVRNGNPETRDAQLAIRDGRTSVLRVARSSAADAKPGALTIRGDGSYLVTGGLAGLGLLVAEWLVDAGAKRLVLMGRREPTPDALRTIAGLEARGASVTVCRGDVSAADDVERAVSIASGLGFPLRGVIHSAGSLDDGVLLQQRWERFEHVMKAKVRGGWLLHRATARLDLDFFVLFSSGASFLGSPGQGNHAAANAFLDSLAAERRVHGLPALSINWGAWSEVGAATRGDVVQRVETKGLEAIDPKRGLLVLAHLMSANPVQAAVLPIQWREFVAAFAGGVAPVLFARVAPAERATRPEPSEKRPSDGGFFETLAGQPPARVRVMLLERLGREAARVLGLNPNEPIDPAQPLNALGMDSLMAVELRNALGHLAGRQLPATLLFNYPTLGELVEYFASTSPAPAPEPAPGPVSGAPAAALDSLSEDELADLLAGKLNEV